MSEKKNRGKETADLPPAPVEFGELVSEVLIDLKAVGPKAALIGVLFQIPPVILIFALPPPAEGSDPSSNPWLYATALYELVTLVATGAAVYLALLRRVKKPLSIASALKEAFGDWFGLIAATLFAQLIVMVFALPAAGAAYLPYALGPDGAPYRSLGAIAGVALALIPVWRALGYAIVTPLVVSGEAYGVDALAKSLDRLKGKRAIVLFGVLAFLLPPLLLQLLLAAPESTDDVLSVVMGGQMPVTFEQRLMEAATALLYPILDLPHTFFNVALFTATRPPKKKEPKSSE